MNYVHNACVPRPVCANAGLSQSRKILAQFVVITIDIGFPTRNHNMVCTSSLHRASKRKLNAAMCGVQLEKKSGSVGTGSGSTPGSGVPIAHRLPCDRLDFRQTLSRHPHDRRYQKIKGVKLTSSMKKSTLFVIPVPSGAKTDDYSSESRDQPMIAVPPASAPIVLGPSRTAAAATASADSADNEGSATLDPVSQLLWSQALRSMH